MFLKEILLNAVCTADRADIADTGARGLFHHVPKLSGEDQLSFSGHHIDLDLQGVAPHACPGKSPHNAHLVCQIGFLVCILLFSQILVQISLCHPDLLLFLLQDLPGRLPADVPYFSLKLANAGLLCVIPGHLPDSAPADGKLILFQAVPADLLGYQMLHGDVELLVLCVAGHLNDFHAVQQRPRDSLQSVGRGHEKHFREIQRHFQIVVPEPVILLAVQHLQKGGEGISLVVVAHLVDLVQQHEGILHPGAADARRDAPRHGAHVCLPVAPDLRLVPDASQGDAHIGLLKRPGQGPGDGGLAGSRRSHQAEDGALSLSCQSPHSQKFQHPLLHLLQAVVILL